MVSLPGMSLPEVNPLEVNPLEVNHLGASLLEAKCAHQTRQARLMLLEKECKGWRRTDQHRPRI